MLEEMLKIGVAGVASGADGGFAVPGTVEKRHGGNALER